MNNLARLLPRVEMLVAIFSQADHYDLWLVECPYSSSGAGCSGIRRVGQPIELKKELTRSPVILLVAGHGVITRQSGAAPEITAKVTAPGSGFIWTDNGGELSFAKLDQLGALKESLAGVKAKVVATQCISIPKVAGEEVVKEVALERAEVYYARSMKISLPFTPSAEGSVMARLIASKLRLPVLGLVLLALVINAFIAPDLRARAASAQVQLRVLEKGIGTTNDVSRRRQELFNEIEQVPTYGMSLLCDRIASVVPQGISLITLAVQPLVRSLEYNKKPRFARGRVEIEGEASGAGDVYRYVSDLGILDVAAKIDLASMEQMEAGSWAFKMTLEL